MKFPLSRIMTFMLAMVAALLTPNPSRASNADMLIVWNGFEYWRWEGGNVFNRLNIPDGIVLKPVLSPDGRDIAFAAIPPIYTILIGGNGFASSEATDIWLHNLHTDTLKQVAAQPKDTVLISFEEPYKYVVRTDPAWSPDGKQLAWAEFIQTQKGIEGQTLVIYDLKSATQRRVTLTSEIQFAPNLSLRGELQWGDHWIAITTPENSRDLNITVYDLKQNLSKSFQLKDATSFVLGLWYSNQQHSFIIAYHEQQSGTKYKLLDPTNGVFSALPLAFRLTSENGMSKLFFNPINGTYYPQFKPSFQTASSVCCYPFAAISNDGLRAAYTVEGPPNPITIYQNEKFETVILPDNIHQVEALIWGPLQWVLK